MGLKKSDNLRDHLSALALTYEMLAEQASAYVLSQKKGLSFDQADAIVSDKAKLVGRQAAEMGRSLNIDIATNKSLFDEHDKAAPPETNNSASA